MPRPYGHHKHDQSAPVFRHHTVSVTQEDIDRATRNRSNRCAVAEAVKSSIPGAVLPQVDIQTIRFSIGDRRFVYLTPRNVQRYIVGFDAGDEIEPFEFHLKELAYTAKRYDSKSGASSTLDYETIVTHKNHKEPGYEGGESGIAAIVPGRPPVVRSNYRRYGMRGMRVNRDEDVS